MWTCEGVGTMICSTYRGPYTLSNDVMYTAHVYTGWWYCSLHCLPEWSPASGETATAETC